MRAQVLYFVLKFAGGVIGSRLSHRAGAGREAFPSTTVALGYVRDELLGSLWPRLAHREKGALRRLGKLSTVDQRVCSAVRCRCVKRGFFFVSW